MADATVTFGSDESGSDTAAIDWALIVALDCDDLAAPPTRVALAGAHAVELGRGEPRAVRRSDGRVRIELADHGASQRHARLTREPDGWLVEDAGSKNGTRVNGRRVDRARLDDGDVLEIGGTFVVLRRAGAAPPATAGGLTTMAPAFERELAVLAPIARSRLPVLVRGESGSGKEVVAHAVHAMSGRRGPLVPVNCGAIPATLVEGELFGSRRGAFSGAEDRTGLIRGADHGTLFLDEVVELPPTSQAALLRFLQDGEVAPLGADRRVVVDVRVVAASNAPIEDRIARGQFRHDLHARLCGHVVHVPALRARREDLGLLVARLLARHDAGGPPRRLTRAAARALFRHDWPLNVRELEHALCSALATAKGAELGAGDLRLVGAGTRAAPDSADPAPGSADPGSERDRLAELLDHHAGNLSAVARALATSRTQVARLLARHGLTRRR